MATETSSFLVHTAPLKHKISELVRHTMNHLETRIHRKSSEWTRALVHGRVHEWIIITSSLAWRMLTLQLSRLSTTSTQRSIIVKRCSFLSLLSNMNFLLNWYICACTVLSKFYRRVNSSLSVHSSFVHIKWQLSLFELRVKVWCKDNPYWFEYAVIMTESLFFTIFQKKSQILKQSECTDCRGNVEALACTFPRLFPAF